MRFRKSGTGKLMHASRNKSHILTKKTTKRKRQLRGEKPLTNKAQIKYVNSVIDH